jgi:hypothetical protein
MTLLNKGKDTAETTHFIEISAFIQNGAVEMVYVSTADMISDVVV